MIFVRLQHEVEERSRAIRADFARRYSSDELREQLYHEQEGICVICNKPMQDSGGVICTTDHATSVYEIANYDWEIKKAIEVANARCNLLAVHVSCNFAKREADYEEFVESIRRGETVLGEVPMLTAERIVALKTAQRERCRKAGRKGGLKGGRIAGRMAVESGHLASIRTRESCSKGGFIGGHNQPREAKEAGGRKGGLIGGRKAVESGRLAALNRKNIENGHLAGLNKLPQSIDARRKTGRKNVESGHLARIRHIRWHARRNIVNPACALCQQAAA